jgi:hypothetical protein
MKLVEKALVESNWVVAQNFFTLTAEGEFFTDKLEH